MKKAKNFIRGLQNFMDSAKGKTILNYLYSWGAAVVILGTLFKLTHIAGANLMLFVGMGTEVLVFFFSAFERPYEVAEDEKKEEAVMANIPAGMGQPIFINGPIMTGGAAVAAGNANVADLSAQPVSLTDNEEVHNVTPQIITSQITAPQVVAQQTVVTPSAAPQTVAVQAEAPQTTTAQPAAQAVPQQPAYIGTPFTGAPVCSNLQAPKIENIEEMDKVTEEYIQQVSLLNEALQRISNQTEALGKNMQEMETLGRNLTGMNALYEVQLRSAGGQLDSIDKINEQTKKMAQQVEDLNALYARMIEAMTTNMNRPQI